MNDLRAAVDLENRLQRVASLLRQQALSGKRRNVENQPAGLTACDQRRVFGLTQGLVLLIELRGQIGRGWLRKSGYRHRERNPNPLAHMPILTGSPNFRQWMALCQSNMDGMLPTCSFGRSWIVRRKSLYTVN